MALHRCLFVQVFGNGEEADIQQDVDMEFGALRAMFGPAGSGLEDRALVQLDLGEWQVHSCAKLSPLGAELQWKSHMLLTVLPAANVLCLRAVLVPAGA